MRLTRETYSRLRGCEIRLDKLTKLKKETLADMRNILKDCDHTYPNGSSAITCEYGGDYCNICDCLV